MGRSGNEGGPPTIGVQEAMYGRAGGTPTGIAKNKSNFTGVKLLLSVDLHTSSMSCIILLCPSEQRTVVGVLVLTPEQSDCE